MTRLYSVRHMFTGAVALALAVTPALRTHAAPGPQLAAAKVSISGTSNVHAWTATTSTVRTVRLAFGPDVQFDDLQTLVGPGAIEAFEVAIPAASLTSPKEGLDKNMHKALRVETFTEITFRLVRLEKTADAAFRGLGTLRIAGVQKDVTLELTIQRVNDTLVVKGEVPLFMTDFGIAPPKAMLGMLKTDPKVIISVETVVAVPQV